MSLKGINHYLEAAKRSAAWHADYRKKMKQCRFDTIAVHGLYSLQEAIDFNQGSVIEPIYMSSSQAYRDSDEMEAALSYQIPTWCYSRIGNPSIYYLEGVLALLETYGADIDASCCATSSGMSAIYSAIDPFLNLDSEQKDAPMNFVANCQVYGGTYQQFSVRKDAEKNIKWRKVIHSHDLKEWEKLIDDNTRFLYGELPSNPSQAFFDIEKVAELAHKHGIPLIIDNTVGTPALIRPLAWGADIVIQSVTKTLTSSGFGISGAVIARKNMNLKINNPALKADFGLYIKAMTNRDNGPNISPMNAILTLNDIRTLRSKIDLMSRSTMKIARYLESHKHIEQVDYLGLESHPLHNLAKKYMFLVDSEFDDCYNERINRYGHLMSFRIKGNAKNTRNVFDAFQRIFRATDIGRIKTIATIPSISTHQQQGEKARDEADIPPNMIRLCVGAEHPDDIIADLDQALAVLDGKNIKCTSPEFSFGGASSAILKR